MNKEFYKLAETIADWHTQTFAEADENGQVLKLVEEFQEFEDSDKSIEELADCFIVAASLSERYGNALGLFVMKAIVKNAADVDGCLFNAVKAKMEVNRNRVWKLQSTGSYHHVEI